MDSIFSNKERARLLGGPADDKTMLINLGVDHIHIPIIKTDDSAWMFAGTPLCYLVSQLVYHRVAETNIFYLRGSNNA